jgi:hypothetical protein
LAAVFLEAAFFSEGEETEEAEGAGAEAAEGTAAEGEGTEEAVVGFEVRTMLIVKDGRGISGIYSTKRFFFISLNARMSGDPDFS